MTKPAANVQIEKFHHILVWPLILRGGKADDITPWMTALDAVGWTDADKPGSTTVAADINYREVVYFHPFARDFLYADGYHTPDARPLRRLVRNDVTRVQVTVGKHPLLDLTVERAELYLCKPNVILFCLEVSSLRTPEGWRQKLDEVPSPLWHTIPDYVPLTLDVVHDFRDQFRRVHPPFFTQPGKTSGQYDAWDSTGAGLCPSEVKWTGLEVSPDAKCRLDSPKSEFDEFTRQGAEPPVFAHWQVWFGNAIRPLPKLITDRPHEPKPRLGSGWRWIVSPVVNAARATRRFFADLNRGVKKLVDRLLCRRPTLYYQQIMDERMQCMSYLAAADPSEITDGDRDRLTFVDAAGTHDFPYNREFLKRTRDAHTYARFDSPEYQTAYFFCSYAFTALGRSKDWFYSNLVLDHFRTLYYRMGITAHFQRAALLYFSDEMSTAAKMLAGHSAASETEHRDYRDKLFAVQMQFIKFRSRSYFPEMTNQLQGQEMNRLWHTHLSIKELFDQVDRTCDQINEVYTQKAAERLSRVAAFFLPLSVGLSLLSVLFAGDFVPKYLAPAASDETTVWTTAWPNGYSISHLLAVVTLLVGVVALEWGWRLRRKS